MVYFTCNACGASLKKNQVEKHYMHQCRSCEVLTCIDCQKDFPGETYKDHTSCISEAEKYSAKGWQPKANANKGAKKQAAWLERLEVLVEKLDDSLDKDVKLVLDAIQGYENIPRKRPKFINFCKNVLSRKFAPASIEKTWDLFEKAIKEPPATSPTPDSVNPESMTGDQVQDEETSEKKKKKKRKATDEDDPDEANETKPTSSPEITNGTNDKSSFNQWETANLGNDQTNEKFRRLMGMGKSGNVAKPMMTSAKHASSVQDSTNLFANQEQQFEKARSSHFSSKGQGLGFAPTSFTKEKKNNQNKRKTFDDQCEDEKDLSNGKENGQSNGNSDEMDQQNGGITMFKGTKGDQAQDEETSEKKKKKKRKATEDNPNEANETKKAKIVENVDPQNKFDWIDCVLEVVSKKGSTKMKKLKKKVVNEYLTLHPDTNKTRLDLESKFEKKIAKSKKLKISNDVVSISTSRDD